MGCLESRPAKKHADNSEKDISIKDMIALRQASLTDQYDLETTPLGNGSRGEVRKAVHKATNQVRAVKIIPRKNLGIDQFIKETNILRNLDHYHITRTFETFQDKQNFYLVTELITGEELFERITNKGTISESFAAKTLKEILSAVSYMHKCGVIHRNLKPESLRFVDNSEDSPIKITNFALAELFRLDDPKKEFVGTLEYIAPEMIKGLYNTSVDVWACGVILYIMLSGTPPFSGATPEEILKSIQEDQIKFEGEVWKEISQEAKDLVGQMLTKEIGRRPNAEQVLQHEWFKKNAGQAQIDIKASKEIVNNLKKYKIQKKIQQAIWMFMVHYVARKEDKEKMLKEFKALDTDNDGQLSRNELVAGLKKSVNFLNYSSVVDSAFEQMDKSHSDYIEYTEFVAAMMDRKALLSKQNLESAFSMLDTDSSGSISVHELRDAFGAEMLLLDDEYWTKLIAEGDINKDGQIDFQEFYKLMMEIKT